MKLSSAYLYEHLREKYEITGIGGISGRDGFGRPFLCAGEDPGRVQGHVLVMENEDEREAQMEIFRILCETSDGCGCPDKERGTPVFPEPDFSPGIRHESPPFLRLRCKSCREVLNDVQELFERCGELNEKLDAFLMEHSGIQKVLTETSSFLKNPLTLMGLDFSPVAEVGTEELPERARFFTDDGINMSYMNALVQDERYQEMRLAEETVLYPDYISGFRSLNRNLSVEGKATHRLILTENHTGLSPGDICILDMAARRLEYLLKREEGQSLTGDLEAVFQRMLSDRTADYVQISRRLSESGWSSSHVYLCLILQTTYLNQSQLSTKAICKYIKKQMPDSVCFLYRDEIVAFFNLTRLKLDEEAAGAKLVYFIRDSYLKAGYSRAMTGHMNLRRQYEQARMALDVGSRKRPYLWIHHFSQVALTYIMEQATRKLPGTMLCHEGLLELKALDAKNHTEYFHTLDTYLRCHLNATQAANELFIHRSTFLYRLEKIREILGEELSDADETFYLELSIRLLEQEEEKS